MRRQHLAYLALLLASLLAAAGTSHFYGMFGDPEVRFWVAAIRQKVEYARKLDAKVPGKIVLAGGSSCAFSLDTKKLRSEHGIEAVNLGTHAGAGWPIQLDLALEVLNEGDVLVLAFETPEYTASGLTHTSLGSKIWSALRTEDILGPSRLALIGADPEYPILMRRPGMRHVLTMAMKWALGRPLYRYSLADLREGGSMSTSYKEELPVPVTQRKEMRIHPDNVALLRRIREYCERSGVRVVAALPWQLTDSAWASHNREENRRLLKEIEAIVPVLSDDSLGVSADASLFSDTEWHLVDEGQFRRTHEFAAAIQAVVAARK